jgi:hypothetical protein
MGAETHAKCIELCRDMLASARQVALIANGVDPTFAKSFSNAKLDAGSEIGPIMTIRDPAELEAAFATVRARRAAKKKKARRR